MPEISKISQRLMYYKRKKIQESIVRYSKDREVGIRYGSRGFGKRPDILMYENDVFSSIKKGATSFHVSEERWSNPMELSAGMSKQELDSLRKGWDLILDIDCPYWHYSKLTAYLFIKALKSHNIRSVSCKFSGNKGFHIGVPFESFPAKINNIPVKDWFPEGPKRIALYLLDYISNNLIRITKTGEIDFAGIFKTTIDEISSKTSKSKKELSRFICKKCRAELKDLNPKKKTEFICQKCGFRIIKEDNTNFLVCKKCNYLMERIEHSPEICSCGSKEYKQVFNPLSIVDVDTILISSRHMYRAPFSLHEKTNLASIPIDPEQVMEFEKSLAQPDKVFPEKLPVFLDSSASFKGEALSLMVESFDFNAHYYNGPENIFKEKNYEFDLPDEAIPEKFFPDSIKKGLNGLKDGKKRFLFILINFLKTCGWSMDAIEHKVREWNKKNPEPLRENYIAGQLRYARMKKKAFPPPNYGSGYYRGLGLEDPEHVMKKYKNPASYTRMLYEKNKKSSRRLTEEQKEMRRKYRQKLKKLKQKGNEDKA